MPKILLVDDEIELLEVLRKCFTDAGYDVDVASDGEEALLRLEKRIPDLIIVDVLMPKMDGFKFVKAVKGKEEFKKIPIFILTAKRAMEDSFSILGVDEFITKPCELSYLVKLADNVAKPEEKPKIKGRRIIVMSELPEQLEFMKAELEKNHFDVIAVSAHAEVLEQAVLNPPAMFILPSLVSGDKTAHVIKLLKQFKACRESEILIFGHLDREQNPSESLSMQLQELEVAKRECVDAGVTEFISLFNMDTFLGTVMKYFVV